MWKKIYLSILNGMSLSRPILYKMPNIKMYWKSLLLTPQNMTKHQNLIWNLVLIGPITYQYPISLLFMPKIDARITGNCKILMLTLMVNIL